MFFTCLWFLLLSWSLLTKLYYESLQHHKVKFMRIKLQRRAQVKGKCLIPFLSFLSFPCINFISFLPATFFFFCFIIRFFFIFCFLHLTFRLTLFPLQPSLDHFKTREKMLIQADGFFTKSLFCIQDMVLDI